MAKRPNSNSTPAAPQPASTQPVDAIPTNAMTLPSDMQATLLAMLARMVPTVSVQNNAPSVPPTVGDAIQLQHSHASAVTVKFDPDALTADTDAFRIAVQDATITREKFDDAQAKSYRAAFALMDSAARTVAKSELAVRELASKIDSYESRIGQRDGFAAHYAAVRGVAIRSGWQQWNRIVAGVEAAEKYKKGTGGSGRPVEQTVTLKQALTRIEQCNAYLVRWQSLEREERVIARIGEALSELSAVKVKEKKDQQ